MKSFSKKLLGVVLSVAMIITMTPFTAFPSQAATNLDGGFQGMDADVFTALGFDVTELPEGYYSTNAKIGNFNVSCYSNIEQEYSSFYYD